MRNDPLRMLVFRILIAGLILWVFGQGVHGPFIFDDSIAIEKNPTFHQDSWWAVLKGKRDTTYSSRPLINLSFAIDYKLYGLNPEPYRWTNIVLQIIIAWVLLGLLSRFLPICLNSSEKNRYLTDWLALLVSLAWSLHPVQTECVLYITQRSEQFAALGIFLSIDGLIRHHLTGKKRWLVMMFTACVVSMGFKQNAAVLPPILLLIDYAFLNGSFRKAYQSKPKAYLAIFAATWSICGAIILYNPNPSCTGTGFGVSRFEYLMTQSQVIWHYLINCYWPAGLCLSYDWPIVRGFSQVRLEFFSLAMLFVLGCLSLIKFPKLSCSILCIFLLLGPTSSVLPLVSEVAADRRISILSIIALLLPVVAVYRLVITIKCSEKQALLAALSLSLITCVCYLPWTMKLSHFYDNPVVLWQHQIDQNTRSKECWIHLGEIYESQKQWAPAWQCYQYHINAPQSNRLAHINLGYIEMNLQRYDRATNYYMTAINDSQFRNKALLGLGLVNKTTQQYDKAITYLRMALAENPDNESAALNLAGICNLKQEHQQAAELLQPFIAKQPSDALYSELGYSYSQLGQLQRAQRMYERYLIQHPSDAKILNSMGVVLAKQGHVKQAATYFKRAVQADPKLEQAKDNLKRAEQMLNPKSNSPQSE